MDRLKALALKALEKIFLFEDGNPRMIPCVVVIGALMLGTMSLADALNPAQAQDAATALIRSDLTNNRPQPGTLVVLRGGRIFPATQPCVGCLLSYNTLFQGMRVNVSMRASDLELSNIKKIVRPGDVDYAEVAATFLKTNF